MIGLPSGARVWLACGVTDLRNGFDGLAGLVQTRLAEDAFSGQLFVFRGLCLFAKRLERGRFVWPRASSGTVHLSAAQLSMLLEGIDWRRPQRTHTPQLAV
jgi:transposase